MEDKTKLIIFATFVMVVFGGIFVIKLYPTYNEYHTIVDGKQFLVARETVNLWDGAAKMRAHDRETTTETINGLIKITKKAYYKDNINTTEVKYFLENTSDIDDFPKDSYVVCDGCQGKILSFTYSHLYDELEEKDDLKSPFYFEPNMKLEWQDGAYYEKTKDYSTVKDKIIIKYRPVKDSETYYVKLTDPPKEYRTLIDYKTFTKKKDAKNDMFVSCVEKKIKEITESVSLDKYTQKEVVKTESRCYDRKHLLDSFKIDLSEDNVYLANRDVVVVLTPRFNLRDGSVIYED